jgi:putative acetyltransferase
MEIRAEKLEDIEAVRRVNIKAFRRESEANLVESLRDITSTLSFVAIKSEQIVGHIFFSPVAIAGECADNLLILGLAPVAVLPEYQGQGIGSLLIKHGLKACDYPSGTLRDRSCVKAVVVLGSPKYYQRFGFTPAKEKGLRCEYKVPDEAFMILELESGALKNCTGTVKYRSEFKQLE